MTTRSEVLRRLTVAGCALLLAAAAPAPVPAVRAMAAQGRGVQIYACLASGAGFAWHFQAPEATLFDAQGQRIGRHFAGPSWQAADGSVVVGEVVASSPGAAGSIPWLVLRARSHNGAGLFASIAYVVRSQTAGGAAPVAGCDRDHAGALARVAYSATYSFFPAPGAAKP